MKKWQVLGAVAALVSLMIVEACSSDQNPLAFQTNTHSRGKAVILIEESFKPLFDTSIYTFESQNPRADIIAKYMPEDEVIKAFYKNAAKTLVISRQFTKEEEKYLLSKHVQVRADKVAIDAVAIIVHPTCKDTMLTVDQLKNILSGKTQTWPKTGSKISVVYDNQNSANYNYMKDFCGTENKTGNVFAQKSNEAVIRYVKETPGSMGVIGLNWISDTDDANVVSFLSGIKIVSLAAREGEDYFQPYSGFMYTMEYPLVRDIWILNKGSRSGLNTGFVLFMIGEKGQTIVQKSSLLPARAPVRLIQFREE